MDQNITEAELRAFLGKDYDYFTKKWDYCDPAKKPKFFDTKSFILWAFLWGMMWYAYRKMYLESVCILLLNIVLFSLLPDSASSGANIGLMMALGKVGPYLYKRHAYKKINKIKEKTSNPDEALVQIEKAGGVNYWAALPFLALNLWSFWLVYQEIVHKSV